MNYTIPSTRVCSFLFAFLLVTTGCVTTRPGLDAKMKCKLGDDALRAHQYSKAEMLYREAADQGSAEGQHKLGQSLLHGGAQNIPEALDWIRKSAEQGYAPGQAGLAEMFKYGYGVARNKKEALRWYRKAADQGDVGAMVEIGMFLENIDGPGIPKNYAEAMKWYRKAADLGDSSGQRFVAGMYEHGHGVAKDTAEAVKWYYKAANQGNFCAQDTLAYLLSTESARLYAEVSASQGGNGFGSAAKCMLGNMYAVGVGVPLDEVKAVEFYRQSAQHLNRYGQYRLAVMLASGRGVPKDEEMAVKFLRQAANGDAFGMAKYELGLMLLEGRGTPKDADEAMKWFRLAAKAGFAPAQAMVQKLEPQ
jgi:TPR repeat protein